MVNLTEKFVQYFRSCGVTRYAFAKSIDVSPSTIDNYLQGLRTPTAEIIAKMFAADPRLSPEWFFLDRGEMLIGELKNDDEQNQEESGQPTEAQTSESETEFLRKQIVVKDKIIETLMKQIADKDMLIQSYISK